MWPKSGQNRSKSVGIKQKSVELEPDSAEVGSHSAHVDQVLGDVGPASAEFGPPSSLAEMTQMSANTKCDGLRPKLANQRIEIQLSRHSSQPSSLATPCAPPHHLLRSAAQRRRHDAGKFR